MLFVLLAVHAEQPGREPAMGGPLGASDCEELRVVLRGIGKNLSIQLGIEKEVHPATIFFERSNRPMLVMKASHTGNGISRELAQWSPRYRQTAPR